MAKHIQADIPNDDFRIVEKWIDAAFRRGSRLPAGLVSSTMHEAMRMYVQADSRPRKFLQPPGILKCRNQRLSHSPKHSGPAGLVSSTMHEAMRMCVHADSRPRKFSQPPEILKCRNHAQTVSLTKAQWKTGGKWQLPGVENNNCKVACAWAATDSTSTF